MARAKPAATRPTGRNAPKPPARRATARRKPLKGSPPPPEKGNGRALKVGAQARGKNLPGYAESRGEIEAVRAEAPWILRSDEPVLEVFVSELTAFRYTADALARLSDTARGKKLNAIKLQIRRARVLGELADRLGLSPQSRFKLGLVVAKAEAVRLQPVRSEARAMAVAKLLKLRATPQRRSCASLTRASRSCGPPHATPMNGSLLPTPLG